MTSSGRPLKVHRDLEFLTHIVEKEDKEQLKIILHHHGVNAFDDEKVSALVWASFLGKTHLMHWLLEMGSDVNHQDRIGYTSLHYCAQEKRIEAAEILPQHGANPNLRDQHGNTPLWTALFNAKGKFEMVKLLLRQGVDSQTKNKHGKSPNDLAN